MPASESDRLLARGAAVRVAEGERAVRFSLLAIKRCEDRYGSLAKTSAELGWLAEQAVAGYPDPVGERLAGLLACATGEPDLLDAWSGPGACIDALVAAWIEAFPVAEGKAPGAETPPTSSPGGVGGASPESSAA